jgi:hypothetical protein
MQNKHLISNTVLLISGTTKIIELNSTNFQVQGETELRTLVVKPNWKPLTASKTPPRVSCFMPTRDHEFASA